MRPVDQKLALQSAATRLQTEFAADFAVETYDQFAGRATIPNFLPLLAERFALQRLHALAHLSPA